MAEISPICGLPMTDILAEEEQELEALIESLCKTCIRHMMAISAKKTKLMTNSSNGIQREIEVKGQKLDTVPDDSYKPDIFLRIEQATAVLTKQKPILGDNNISLGRVREKNTGL